MTLAKFLRSLSQCLRGLSPRSRPRQQMQASLRPRRAAVAVLPHHHRTASRPSIRDLHVLLYPRHHCSPSPILSYHNRTTSHLSHPDLHVLRYPRHYYSPSPILSHPGWTTSHPFHPHLHVLLYLLHLSTPRTILLHHHSTISPPFPPRSPRLLPSSPSLLPPPYPFSLPNNKPPLPARSPRSPASSLLPILSPAPASAPVLHDATTKTSAPRALSGHHPRRNRGIVALVGRTMRNVYVHGLSYRAIVKRTAKARVKGRSRGRGRRTEPWGSFSYYSEGVELVRLKSFLLSSLFLQTEVRDEATHALASEIYAFSRFCHPM